MVRILSTDLLVADLIAQTHAHDELQELAKTYNLASGGKRSLNEEEAREFAKVFSKVEHSIAPGGSSANMLSTLSGLLGKEVEIRFVGVPGEGHHGEVIRNAMSDANITLLPEHIPSGVSTREAVSFALVDEDGQCSTATYPGNARNVLKPALLPEHLVEHAEVVLVQGSLWHKFSEEFMERLCSLTKKHDRALWLTLPTQAEVSAAEKEKFEATLPQAELLLGNSGELMRLYGENLGDAIVTLQKHLRTPDKTKERMSGVAFITTGAEGCLLVTRDSVKEIPADISPDIEIVNTLGAGDTAYAGFAAGYLSKMSIQESAQLAMVLAGLKLAENHPRLDTPLASLKEKAPELAKQLLQA